LGAALASSMAPMASSAAASLQSADMDAGAAKAPGLVGANLFVYHVPLSWDDGILQQHFEHFGSIVSCRVQKDPEGRPRGFGFVSYDSGSAAQAAIAGMHGFPVEGKWLKVQLKKGDEEQLGVSSHPLPTIGTPPMQSLVDLPGTQPEAGLSFDPNGVVQIPRPGAPPPPPGLPPYAAMISGRPPHLRPARIAPIRPIGLSSTVRPGPY
jgi:RNA recognition motif-containing protein